MFCGREHPVWVRGTSWCRPILVHAASKVMRSSMMCFCHWSMVSSLRRGPPSRHRRANSPESPELAGCMPDLDDLLIDQRAALRSAPDPLRTGFFGRTIASQHIVLDVTFADTQFEECVGVLAQVFGCAALAGLGALIHRRHDLPPRQVADGQIDMDFETRSQRRHRWLPVDDLASS